MNGIRDAKANERVCARRFGPSVCLSYFYFYIYRRAATMAAAAKPPIEEPNFEAAPVKVTRPVEDETVRLAVVLVEVATAAMAAVVTADPLPLPLPEPEPEPESDPLEPELDPVEPVATAAAPVTVAAGTRAATAVVAPAAVTVWNCTWGTVRIVETTMVVDDPAMIDPSLIPAVCVIACTNVVAYV